MIPGHPENPLTITRTTPATLSRMEADAVASKGRNIDAVVQALLRAGVEIGENGSIIPRPKGKPR